MRGLDRPAIFHTEEQGHKRREGKALRDAIPPVADRPSPPGGSGMRIPRLGVGKTISRRDGKQPGGEEEIAYDRMEAAAPTVGQQAGETGDRVPRPDPA